MLKRNCVLGCRNDAAARTRDKPAISQRHHTAAVAI